MSPYLEAYKIIANKISYLKVYLFYNLNKNKIVILESLNYNKKKIMILGYLVETYDILVGKLIYILAFVIFL